MGGKWTPVVDRRYHEGKMKMENTHGLEKSIRFLGGIRKSSVVGSFVYLFFSLLDAMHIKFGVLLNEFSKIINDIRFCLVSDNKNICTSTNTFPFLIAI